jgi:hypothetical protein
MMATNPITRLADTRVLKKMGMPVNMPVERKFFSEDYSSHWLGLQNAHCRFMIAVHEHGNGPRAESLGKWRLIERRFARLRKEMLRCETFIGKPVAGEQSEMEAQILASLITEQAMPFVEFWQRTFDAIAEDGMVTIEPSDIPAWLDNE